MGTSLGFSWGTIKIQNKRINATSFESKTDLPKQAHMGRSRTEPPGNIKNENPFFLDQVVESPRRGAQSGGTELQTAWPPRISWRRLGLGGKKKRKEMGRAQQDETLRMRTKRGKSRCVAPLRVLSYQATLVV